MSDVTDALNVLYRERSRILIYGLTGRTGSGCTTLSKLLTKNFDELFLPKPVSDPSHPDERKYRILHKFATENWKPFTRISVTCVILSFIVQETSSSLRSFITNTFDRKFSQDEIGALAQLVEKIRNAGPLQSETFGKRAEALGESDGYKLLNFFTIEAEALLQDFREKLKSNYTPFFQIVGDNLRKSGTPYSDKVDAENIFAIAKRVDWMVRLVVRLDEAAARPSRVVLDAMRNPFEAIFFRDRYPSYYLVAVNAPDADRQERLSAKLSKSQIQEFDDKEYPKKKRSKSSTYEAYISQDIQGCIEKADIHIHNAGVTKSGEEQNLSALAKDLIRYVSLSVHPGLVTPTRAERCMQIAYSAKLNSGCISRQVGAVVTDEDGAIKSVGWNDVPFKQVPCLLRDVDDLISGQDKTAFSTFELSDKGFRDHLKKLFPSNQQSVAGGRSCAFCFKDAINSQTKDNDRSMTRSLHAEENAFLQISKSGGGGLKGGHLYTTASPCELCSKKAFQLGIARIWFVDPYPGISQKQILESGDKNFRPQMMLFFGAIGDAYHRLYDPLMAHKDEINAYVAEAGAPIDFFPSSPDKKTSAKKRS